MRGILRHFRSKGLAQSTLCYLRADLQSKPELIPDDVLARELRRRKKEKDWLQRARLLWSVRRFDEATADYLRGISESLEEGNRFSAAYYLKEMTENGAINKLFAQALTEAEERDDLWWQVRALQELEWRDELRRRVLSWEQRIEEFKDLQLMQLLALAKGDSDTFIELSKLEASRTQMFGAIVLLPRTTDPETDTAAVTTLEEFAGKDDDE